MNQHTTLVIIPIDLVPSLKQCHQRTTGGIHLMYHVYTLLPSLLKSIIMV
jgi:hypothetical protein